MNASFVRFGLGALAAVLFLLPVGRTHADTIIPFDASWEWLHPQDGIDPALDDPDFNFTWQIPAAYNGPDFNPPSPAELGFGDGDEATNIGTPPSGSRYSAYFRHDFTVPAGGYTDLAMSAVRDDGIIVYLDGFEIARSNMPADDDSYTLFALSALGAPEESTVYPIDFSAVGLTLDPGEHTLAVSLHQGNTTSSDLSFKLELTGTPGVVPEPSTSLLGALGLVALVASQRRRFSRQTV